MLLRWMRAARDVRNFWEWLPVRLSMIDHSKGA
jgi:hypothetical protein